jgi:hypothetical protein
MLKAEVMWSTARLEWGVSEVGKVIGWNGKPLFDTLKPKRLGLYCSVEIHEAINGDKATSYTEYSVLIIYEEQ